MKSLALALLLSSASFSVLADECVDPSIDDVKRLVRDSVQNTERQRVLSVQVTAPGLAAVVYGQNQKLRVTFVFDCLHNPSAEKTRDNPTGFRVVSYVPVK